MHGVIYYNILFNMESHPEERNKADYLNKYRDGWQLADLCQLARNGRGRTETVEGHLPTLTTNSARLWSKVHVFRNKSIWNIHDNSIQ